MLKDIYGDKFDQNANAKSIIKKINEFTEPVDINTFRKFAKQHQALLFPAFMMQTKMQSKILGCRFWSSLANKRIEISKGRYIPISEFLKLHTNKDMLQATVTGNILESRKRRFSTVQHERDDGKITDKAIQLIHQTGPIALRGNALDISEKVGKKTSTTNHSSVNNIHLSKNTKTLPRIDSGWEYNASGINTNPSESNKSKPTPTYKRRQTLTHISSVLTVRADQSDVIDLSILAKQMNKSIISKDKIAIKPSKKTENDDSGRVSSKSRRKTLN
jgi:hypothetical protein